jgi:hypothetical protein
MAASRFVEVSNKEISEIKMIQIRKTQKNFLKKTSGSVIIGEYSPRIFDFRIFPDNHLAFGE